MNLRLLAELCDGRFHSGEILAENLNVSRAVISTQVAELNALDLGIEAVPGKGYRLPGGLELLSAERLHYALDVPTREMIETVDIVPQLDSTNAELLRRPPITPGRAAVCVAERQSAGRGRRGREWVSPFARNLYLSVAWDFVEGVAVLWGLSLAVGVAVAEALLKCGLPAPRLKWPNDIHYEGRKCGGVLIEVNGDAAGPCRAVVGIGLNVRMPAASAAAVDQPWIDLAAVAGKVPLARNALLAAVLNEVVPLLRSYPERGFAPLRSRWCALDAHAGRQVMVDMGNRRVAGVARGVDQRGGLLLETASGIQTIHSGDVSLRVAAADAMAG